MRFGEVFVILYTNTLYVSSSMKMKISLTLDVYEHFNVLPFEKYMSLVVQVVMKYSYKLNCSQSGENSNHLVPQMKNKMYIVAVNYK